MVLTKVFEGIIRASGLVGSSLAATARAGEREGPWDLMVCPESEGGGGTSEGTSMENVGTREL